MRSITVAVVMALGSVVGCAPTPPIAVAPTNNPLVQVETLFDHDGCTVYRFRDQGILHYFARCDGPPAQAEAVTTERCGKKCVEDVITVTTRVAKPGEVAVERR